MSPPDHAPTAPPRFADEQLAAFVAQPSSALAQLDVAAMRAGVAERALSRPRGPAMAEVCDVSAGAVRARVFRPSDYANTDLGDDSSPSMRENASGHGLSVETIHFFNGQWVPDRARWSDPAVSPLRAPDLSGLPAALVVTAEHGPLRDQGEAYPCRLADAGVPVTQRREAGLIHNFMLLDELSPAAAAAADRVAADIARLLGA